MIYVDSSVALARLLFEPRAPPGLFWQEQLVSSRLLEYEVWNRVHAYDLIRSHADEARVMLMGIELVEMDRRVLARALEPLPVAVRTLDALHLATIDFLSNRGEAVEFATYDNRLLAAGARAGHPYCSVVTAALGSAPR